MSPRFHHLIAAMSLITAGFIVSPQASARHGADDPAGHVHQCRGCDDAPGHVRRARGADDAAGDDRRMRSRERENSRTEDRRNRGSDDHGRNRGSDSSRIAE